MKLRNSILFILSVIIMLAALCVVFPQPSVTVAGMALRFPSLDKMLERPHSDSIRSAEELLKVAESTLSMAAVSEPAVERLDSAAQAMADSLAFYKKFFETSPTRIYCPKDNNPEYLFGFFDALDKASKESVHIMHYGDSQIEGDRISGYIRSRMQKKFGGSGPGLIPLRQPISAMSVQQTITDSVTMYYAGGMMGKRAPHKRYGAMAQVAQVSCTDTILFSAKSHRGKDFSRVTIFAGGVDEKLEVGIDSEYHAFGPNEELQTAIFDLGRKRDEFEIQLCGTGEVYGINISDKIGVSVSNIPLRGSDGTFFSRIDPQAIKGMLKHLNTRMVIMEFGGNALPMITDSASVEKWCGYFKGQVGYMKRMLPKAVVLVIGPADMSIKIDGELQTHPMLPYLVDLMRTSTVDEGAAFWDMYSVMGGKNSMQAWVDHKPKWAAPDYVHFTKKGADRISEVLWESLMVYYNYRDFMKTTKSSKHKR